LATYKKINGEAVKLSGESGTSTANQISYDNTTSGMTATDVQAAVDELNSDLDNKQDKLTNPLTKSDVVNNLTTTTTNVPLSAAQGKALNDAKQPKTMSTTIAGATTVEGCLGTLNTNLSNKFSNLDASSSTVEVALSSEFSKMANGSIRLGHLNAGWGGGYIIDRTTANYGCALVFSYGNFFHYTYSNGTWTQRTISWEY